MSKIPSRLVKGLDGSYKKQWLSDLTRNADISRCNYGHLVDDNGIDAPVILLTDTKDASLTKQERADFGNGAITYSGGIAFDTPTVNSGSRVFTCSSSTALATTMPALDVNGKPLWSATESGKRGYFKVSFYTDSLLLALHTDTTAIQSSESRYRVKINGRYINGGSFYYATEKFLHLSFTSKITRLVELEIPAGAMRFIGCWVTSFDTVKKPSSEESAIAFVTDSLGEGVGADYPEDAWPVYFAQYFGLENVLYNTAGGTGFIRRTDAGNAYSFRDRLQDLKIGNIGTVIISASINDNLYTTRNGDGTLPQAVSDYINALKAALPSVNILIIGVVGKVTQDEINSATKTRLDVENDVILGISLSNYADEIVFLPVQTDIGGAIISGTGNVSSQTADGNADIYVAADGEHLSSAGQLHFAVSIATRVARLVV